MDSESHGSSKKDPAWKYAHLADPTGKNKNDIICNFCGKLTKGGICRAKQHIVGGFRNAKGCQKCPPHVREEIKDYMLRKVEEKKQGNLLPDFDDMEDYGVDEEDEIQMVGPRNKRSGGTSGSSMASSKAPSSKKPKEKGPIDLYFTPDAEMVVRSRKEGKGKQTTINEVCKKELRDKACREVARWMYDAGIPFNAVNYPSFAVAIEAIGQFGPGLKPPSYHEVRVPLLRKEVEHTRDLMKGHQEEWARYGCSIMSDGWKDEIAKKDIINFLVNSPKGSVFIKSVDASHTVKSGNLLFKLLDDMVEQIGEANVIQVVTDNASNYVAAGRIQFE